MNLNRKLDKLHDQIMNLPCTSPWRTSDSFADYWYRIGHKDARHTAATLVAEAQSDFLPDPEFMQKIKEIGGHGYREINGKLAHINDGREDWGNPSNNCPACNGSGHKGDMREGYVLVPRSAIVSVLTDAEHLAKTGKDLKDALNDLWKAEQSEDEENLDGLNDTVSDYWKGLNSAAYDLRKRASNLRLLIEEKPQREMK
ncbi:hypothetical protein [Oxalobacter paraformigenes]|uniref:Uncharacterized protein n=1 Tax=Oxalobacter paraformigenes TaxID=556268 RepID=T5LUJ3_9BURK|nr:hypothetical protein [Oxalobacter paraformigenes]EQM95158.1 hypothetical protein OFAG_02254 [Oxalobacter paraformigenes]